MMAETVVGVPCWADVMLPDLAAGKRFYGALFGWTFDEEAEGADSYAPALLDGRFAAALGQKTDGRMPTSWTQYLAAPDAAETAERVRAAGGVVITEPLEVGSAPAGVLGIAADPGGAVFGFWQSLGFGGFEVSRRPGAYVWTEVYVREKHRVDAFYREVFGYGTADISEEGFDFLLWAPEGEPPDETNAVGGRCMITDAFVEEMPPHFLTYFMVEDCEQTVLLAQELGGRAVFPVENSQYGRFAVIADDQGATFAVLDPAPSGPES